MRESILRQYEKYKEIMLLGRVVSIHKSIYNIESLEKSFTGKVSGRFSYNVIDNTEYPVVGDYVIFRTDEYDDSTFDIMRENSNNLQAILRVSGL